MARSEAASGQGVRVVFVLPADPEALRIGGIASFVRGFVKFAPDDFEFAFVGVSGTRPAGRWARVQLEGRSVELLPAARVQSARRSRIPVSLRFAIGMRAHRRALPAAPWIASLHRPGSTFGLPSTGVVMWRVVHLTTEDLTTPGSESRWRRLGRVLEAIERRALRGMDRIYVVNAAAATRLAAEPGFGDRVRFLPNWADSTIFAPADREGRTAARDRLLAELGLHGAHPVVLVAGRIEGQKDPLLAAQTFGRVLERHRDASLLVAGHGGLESQLRRELSRLGAEDRSRLLGTVERPRLAALMRAADVLLLTSRFETGPTVGLEALASGLPVVTTDVGQVAEVVRASGAGAVAGDREPATLADGVESAVAMGPDARERAASAAAPYLAETVLGELYDYNRALAARLRSAGSTGTGTGTLTA